MKVSGLGEGRAGVRAAIAIGLAGGGARSGTHPQPGGKPARLPPQSAQPAGWGAHPRSASTVTFIYFTALAPAVAFGALTSVATGGALGVPDTLVSIAVGGLVYAAASGQPTVLLGPTGLTLAFTTALAGAAAAAGLPFLPVFGWTGVWGGALLVAAGVANAAAGLAGVTAFTTDVFNALIGCNFLVGGGKPLLATATARAAGPPRQTRC